MRRSAIAMLVPALLASCVAPPVERLQPLPPRSAAVAPPPAPVVAPGSAETVEPGEWRYANGVARFGSGGAADLSIECLSAERVILVRVAQPAASLTLRASTTLKSVPATGGVARLDPRDPILDALAFSRGRFGVASRWYPAWPELTRVIEDCRA